MMLFPEVLPSGAQVIPDWVSEKQEQLLLEWIYRGAWWDTLSRRTQHYGYLYNYKKRSVTKLPEPVPELWNYIISSIMDKVDEVLINEYRPGQSIASHVDAAVFGPVVATLSLCSSRPMIFKKNKEKLDVLLPRRSLLVLSGEARYDWSHSIDYPNILSYQRISVTFRTIEEKV